MSLIFKKYYLFFIWFALLPLFFYRLGSTALMSYDEAWYAEITRNMVITKNPLHLQFNGQLFTDHPPFGFVLMAIPTFILGSNEFSARLVSAALGAGSVILIYMVGKDIKNSHMGLIASAVLLSSMWFMFRARSGNLDIPFLFFQILTVLLLLQKSKHFLYYAGISFACLFLIKTLIGVGLIPVGLYILWMRRKDWDFHQLGKAMSLCAIIILPWYLYNQYIYSNFLHHHFFEIGMRSEQNGFSLSSLRDSFLYIQIGIGKWYKIFLVSVILGLLSFILQKKTRYYWILLITWFIGYSTFLFSEKTEIWHLIPLYPMISLVIGFGMMNVIDVFGKRYFLLSYVAVTGALLLAAYQFRQFSNLIYAPETEVYSAEKDISIRARKYTNIHLVETFYPAAVYYTQQTISPLHWDPQAYQVMTTKLQTNEKAVFIINDQLRRDLQRDNIPHAEIEQNNSYYVITSSN